MHEGFYQIVSGEGGVDRVLSCVAKIRNSFQNMKKYSMAGIKALNNFSFESVGMRAWKE